MIQINVTIMGQSYRLACHEDEEKKLREAVAYLDGKMCAIRDAGKIKGNDRIAVMASLAIAAELLSTKSPSGSVVRNDHVGDQTENGGHEQCAGSGAPSTRRSFLTRCKFSGSKQLTEVLIQVD